MGGFVHALGSATTISEIERVRAAISPDEFFGCYAYATQSGFRAFELAVGSGFWVTTESRWLFGIDYGRTDPRALREIAARANTEVRVYDGSHVVNSAGFIPRRDFHPKVAMLKNTTDKSHGIVLGSGNFSYNGLLRSVEAGSSIVATNKLHYNEHINPVRSKFEELWSDASPLDEIAESYEDSLKKLIKARDANASKKTKAATTGFWIEAGYVTKNRGPEKPGNQIFAPNGFCRFFGLKKKFGGVSTEIGEVVFVTDAGTVVKNYRENDNGMEKLGLPTPEHHGYGVYDGKVLVFHPEDGGFRLIAIEPDDFRRVYEHRLLNVKKMIGGRRFGSLV